jgi:uncharacterized protein
MSLLPFVIAAQFYSSASLEPIPFTEVTISDRFWAPRQERNRTVSIPHVLEQLELTPRVQNMINAAAGEGEFKGLIFDDSDVYKALESASMALANHPDPALKTKVDRLIGIIARLQRPDGYINSYYEINAPDRIFTNLRDNHELYCMGHLIEAGVAHKLATGEDTLLNVARKSADLICRTFGDKPGQRMGYPGHPELELALYKLYKLTGDQKYLETTRFFLESRGSKFFATEHNTPLDRFDGTYWTDDAPLKEQTEIKGHAVRAAYLYSAVADVAREGGSDWHAVLDRVWSNMTYKRLFITGGIGPSGSNEGFTVDYDLPNQSAYQETCASIAVIMWNHRLGLLRADKKYWDVLERSLYNGFLAGINLKGDRFFYVNPLASAGNHHRVPWFACACCPPNVTRTLASLGQYAYAKSDHELYVNLFIGGKVETEVGGRKVAVEVETDYPYDGKVTIRPLTEGSLTIKVRIPEWAKDTHFTAGQIENGYLTVAKNWRRGDDLDIEFPMPVERVLAHPAVTNNAGRAAIQRGPLVYCLEQADNAAPVNEVMVPVGAPWNLERDAELGVVTLTADGYRLSTPTWRRRLYQPAGVGEKVAVTAIPYYAWDNREAGRMEVWIPYAPPTPVAGGPETEANVSLSFTSNICDPNAIRDQKPITSSRVHPGQLTHFWPHKGTEEWVQYTWTEPLTVTGCKVYWFDDTGYGECRPPVSWRLEYLMNGAWRPVEGVTYGVALDQWNEVKFPAVQTTALRLAMKLQPEWSVGIHEWQVTATD